MMEVLNKRPLSQHYLWQLCQNYSKKNKEDSDFLTCKQAIGQLKAERKNLEKLNDTSVRLSISSLAFLEEMLNELSEESFRILLLEIQEIYMPKEQGTEINGVWGMPQN